MSTIWRYLQTAAWPQPELQPEPQPDCSSLYTNNGGVTVTQTAAVRTTAVCLGHYNSFWCLCIYIFSVWWRNPFGRKGMWCKVNMWTSHSKPCSPKNGACGVFLPRHIRRQLYKIITTEELPLPVPGANLGQGHLGVTLCFCAWISRWVQVLCDCDLPALEPLMYACLVWQLNITDAVSDILNTAVYKFNLCKQIYPLIHRVSSTSDISIQLNSNKMALVAFIAKISEGPKLEYFSQICVRW